MIERHIVARPQIGEPQGEEPMVSCKRFVLSLVLPVSLATVGTSQAQADQEVQRLKQYLNGRRILVAYREGEVLYGKYIELDINFCPGTERFITFGKSKKRTILDNIQRNSWTDRGRWSVRRFRGRVGVHYITDKDVQGFIPVVLLPDGRIQSTRAVKVRAVGRARCR